MIHKFFRDVCNFDLPNFDLYNFSSIDFFFIYNFKNLKKKNRVFKLL